MKKITVDRRGYLIACSIKRERRRIVSKQKSHQRRFRKAYSLAKPPTNPFTPNTRIRLKLPPIMSLQDNYDETMSFFQGLREAIKKNRSALYVDFTGLRKIHSCTALMLAAELDRWSQIKGVRLRAKKLAKWDPEILRLLSQMGLFELLEVSAPSLNKLAVIEDGARRYIKFSTDNTTTGLFAKRLRQDLEAAAHETIEGRRHLFNGLTEAMTNVAHHAYPDEVEYEYEPIRNQWWMSGSVDRVKNSITASFYDQGVGIPATLPAKYPLEHIKEFFDNVGLLNNDASMIKAAMTLGRTSTEETNRGRGLLNVRQFAANSKKGRLRILSGRGEYIFYSDGRDELINHHQPLGGTLIQWIVYM